MTEVKGQKELKSRRTGSGGETFGARMKTNNKINPLYLALGPAFVPRLQASSRSHHCTTPDGSIECRVDWFNWFLGKTIILNKEPLLREFGLLFIASPCYEEHTFTLRSVSGFCTCAIGLSRDKWRSFRAMGLQELQRIPFGILWRIHFIIYIFFILAKGE